MSPSLPPFIFSSVSHTRAKQWGHHGSNNPSSHLKDNPLTANTWFYPILKLILLKTYTKAHLSLQCVGHLLDVVEDASVPLELVIGPRFEVAVRAPDTANVRGQTAVDGVEPCRDVRHLVRVGDAKQRFQNTSERAVILTFSTFAKTSLKFGLSNLLNLPRYSAVETAISSL